MAISSTHYQLLKAIRHLLPRGGSLLEIGEANWYGDVAPDFPCPTTDDGFAIAKALYAHLFAPSKIVSIDLHGTPAALRCDLNKPLPITDQFDVVINHGTAEHIFNIAQVFKSIHDRCTVGGLMIHESPFTGWIDHGFWCLQPTLFCDLAAANNYEITLVAIEEIKSQTIILVNARSHVAELLQAGHIPDNANLFVVFRKLGDNPFRVPIQGYYAGTVGPDVTEAWEKMR